MMLLLVPRNCVVDGGLGGGEGLVGGVIKSTLLGDPSLLRFGVPSLLSPWV